MTKPNLPAWARLADDQPEGYTPRVLVDADAMYRAWLDELAANPPAASSEAERKAGAVAFPAFPAQQIQIRNAAPGAKQGTASVAAMTAAEAACDPAKPTQYWLEVAYQCAKMDLQVAMRTPGFEIRILDAEKTFALAKWPEGRGIVAATWGKEAREHFRRCRGFVP